jgi:hypothetical protein
MFENMLVCMELVLVTCVSSSKLMLMHWFVGLIEHGNIGCGMGTTSTWWQRQVHASKLTRRQCDIIQRSPLGI